MGASVILVVGVAGADLFFSSDFGPRLSTQLNVLIFAVAAALSAPLAWRRTRPTGVFLIVWTLTTASILFVDAYRPVLPLLIALYSVARFGPRSGVRTPALISLAPLVLAIRDEASTLAGDEVVVGTVGTTVALAALWSLALITGLRAARSERRIDDLRINAARSAREAVLIERQHMARELHDIVAHSVTVMSVQAAGALRVVESAPEQASRALRAIERTGVTTGRELSRLLRVIDPGDASTADESGLAGAVESARAAGLDVTIEGEGTLAGLDPSLVLAVRRVVQESLTNTLRYAGIGATVRVELRRDVEQLHLLVADLGGAGTAETSSLSTGHGLAGMRERIRTLGGTLHAGPVGDTDDPGGWEVVACLPLDLSGPGPARHHSSLPMTDEGESGVHVRRR